MKKHNIIIERWPGNDGPRGQRGTPGFRWTVSFDRDGRYFFQGFEDTHAAARAAAEAYLKEQGINLDWIPRPADSAKVLKKRSKRQVL